MAATVIIQTGYGTVPTTETATTLNMASANVSGNTSASSNPIQKPSAGTNYSYERYFRAGVTNMGGLTKVDNFRVYISENNPSTGVTYNYGQASSFTTPVNTASSIADSAMDESLPSSENLYIGGSSGGSIESATNYTDWAVMQLAVTSAASVVSGSPTVTVVWDETA